MAFLKDGKPVNLELNDLIKKTSEYKYTFKTFLKGWIPIYGFINTQKQRNNYNLQNNLLKEKQYLLAFNKFIDIDLIYFLNPNTNKENLGNFVYGNEYLGFEIRSLFE
ncbi:MAG: hypothetical protein NT007_01220 [Candidatus Kapabacteria bacterium]|nr:hypothetical protein [Candidatus Kapabacteria bacterium]